MPEEIKYAGIKTLSRLKQFNDETFAPKEHLHTTVDIEDYVAPVQADWNESDETALSFVKNRTHYTESGEVLFDEDVTLGIGNGYQGNASFANSIDIKPNKAYIVTYDGVDTTVTSSAGGYIGFTLNNQNIQIMTDGLSVDYPNTTTNHLTIKSTDEIHQLDEKYLPESDKYSDVFTINATLGDVPDSFVPDKTYEELVEAYNNNKVIKLVLVKEFPFNFTLTNDPLTGLAIFTAYEIVELGGIVLGIYVFDSEVNMVNRVGSFDIDFDRNLLTTANKSLTGAINEVVASIKDVEGSIPTKPLSTICTVSDTGLYHLDITQFTETGAYRYHVDTSAESLIVKVYDGDTFISNISLLGNNFLTIRIVAQMGLYGFYYNSGYCTYSGGTWLTYNYVTGNRALTTANSNSATESYSPTADTDLATKAYADSLVSNIVMSCEEIPKTDNTIIEKLETMIPLNTWKSDEDILYCPWIYFDNLHGGHETEYVYKYYEFSFMQTMSSGIKRSYTLTGEELKNGAVMLDDRNYKSNVLKNGSLVLYFISDLSTLTEEHSGLFSQCGIYVWCNNASVAEQISEMKSMAYNYYGLDVKYIPSSIARVPADEEMVELLMDTGIADPAANSAGAIYTDNNGNLYTL